MEFPFLEVQDGVLANASKVMNRMIELKGLSQDVLKNSSDNDNYNREFRNLQVQLYEMSHLTFNGVSMFANRNSEDTQDAIFDDMSQNLTLDNTMSIYVSSDGTSGPTVSINKALLLSALSIDPEWQLLEQVFPTQQELQEMVTLQHLHPKHMLKVLTRKIYQLESSQSLGELSHSSCRQWRYDVKVTVCI